MLMIMACLPSEALRVSGVPLDIGARDLSMVRVSCMVVERLCIPHASFSTKNLNAFLGDTYHFRQRFSLFYGTYTGRMIMGRLLRRDGALNRSIGRRLRYSWFLEPVRRHPG